MKPEALSLLQNDLILQDMVVTWPSVAYSVKIKGKKPKWPKFESAQAYDQRLDVLDLWSQATGHDLDDLHKRAVILFMNEICYPDGRSDELALAFITQEVKRRSGIFPNQPLGNDR